MITVFIADDHPMVRQGLRAVLETLDDIDVIGEADNGRTAVESCRLTPPAVAIIDLDMPQLHGIEAIRQLNATHPNIAILVLTMYEDDDMVFSAVRAGALGYLVKGADGDELIAAVRAAASGQAVFGLALARKLRTWFATSPDAPTRTPFPTLTGREHEILDRLAAGRTNAEIGAVLYLSPKTVANNVSNILNKLLVSSRSQAVAIARDAGLGVDPHHDQPTQSDSHH